MRRTFVASLTLSAVIGSMLTLLPTSPAQAVQPVPGHRGLVPATPRTNVPRITSGEITDLEYIGNRVFVAGTFSSITNNTSANRTTINQAFLASYNIDTGLVDTNFRPTFGGGGVTEVEASPDGTKLFVAGRFNSINGVTKRKIASINPNTGAPIAGFTANANSAATTLAATNTTVFVGGQFSTVNGAARSALAAVDATTGALRAGFVNNITGGIGVNGALTVQELRLTHDDSQLMVVHTGRQVNGQDRYGVAMIDAVNYQLLPWRTRLWQDNLQFVGGIQRAYAGDIAPNDQYFVVTSGSGGDRPPINDTAVAFPTAGGDNVQPIWVSRHFDSVYSVAISETAVYVGGHFSFMESPTANDPWPGLDNVGYGTGQGLGGYGLGDQVVRRDHIGALDPATGKALEWNPGSNSFEGNKAMLVTPRGLFAGGDATTQGGSNVGRVAFYDFNSVPAPGANETTITDPIEGRVVPAATPFVVSGRGTATSGVRRVQVEVIDRATNRYLQDDLVTWGAANTIIATLATPNATQTTWSLQLNIPGNRALQLRAKTFARNGTSDATKAVKKIETFGTSDRTPTASISSPGFGSVITSTTFTVNGTASDDIGVSSLSYTLRDEQNRYLQDDGSATSNYNSTRIQPDVVGSPNTTWSFDVTVPHEGEWKLQVTPVDTMGQSSLDTIDRTFMVSTSAISPSVAITTPAVMTPPTTANPLTLPPGGSWTFSGSASDDRDLNFVEISLRNTTTRENLAADGTWGTDVVPGWHRVSGPTSISGTTYNWGWSTGSIELRPGSYTFQVRATDDEGLTTSSANTGRLTINVQVAGDAPPDTGLSVTGTQTTVQVLHLDLAGTGTDDRGVAEVRVALREAGTGRYLQSNGSMTTSFTMLAATLASPGATSTSWTLPVDLPSAGDWNITAYAFDNVGQQDTSTTGATARYLIYPGDQPPMVVQDLLAPTDGTAFTESRIFISGRIEDDQATTQAQIAVVDSAGRYLTSSGTFGTTAENWIRAFLTSPGSPGSNYAYTTSPLPSGAYTVRVRGVDQHGFITPTPTDVRVTVSSPPGNVAPTANFTISCTNNVCEFDGRSSTDENPTTLTYAWSFGTATSSGAVVTRTFTSAGTFTVTLTARDEYGIASTPTSQTVTITEPPGNVAPTAVINPPSCAGLTCNISGVGSSDPNVGDAISYLWNFGDGTPTSTLAAMTHTFPAAGNYTVILTVADGWGRSTTTSRVVSVT